MFTSDKGVMWAEHGLADKGFPYLGDLRVPVLLRWPGHVTPGTSDPRLAANIDIAPTILDAVGLAPTPARPMDGRSLLAPEGPRTLLGEWWVTPKRRFYAPTWSALLTSRFEFVEYRTVHHVIAREYCDLVRDRGSSGTSSTTGSAGTARTSKRSTSGSERCGAAPVRRVHSRITRRDDGPDHPAALPDLVGRGIEPHERRWPSIGR